MKTYIQTKINDKWRLVVNINASASEYHQHLVWMLYRFIQAKQNKGEDVTKKMVLDEREELLTSTFCSDLNE